MLERSTMEAIETNDGVLQRKKKRLAHGFNDLKQAYDKVPREIIWWARTKKGISKNYINIMLDIY